MVYECALVESQSIPSQDISYAKIIYGQLRYNSQIEKYLHAEEICCFIYTILTTVYLATLLEQISLCLSELSVVLVI